MRYVSFGLIVALLALPSAADARVKKIVIEKKVSPAFDGATFGPSGQYETIAGRAFGELDPADPRNAIITDIKLAPKNAAGKVEYIVSFYLVKPIDMTKASHRRRPRHHQSSRAQCRRHRVEQRLAGRQLGPHGSGRRQ